ncbi:hypothetical protein [Parafrankia colletiae]|nr:hypothetical protein [Parafrankia colletiae]
MADVLMPFPAMSARCGDIDITADRVRDLLTRRRSGAPAGWLL